VWECFSVPGSVVPELRLVPRCRDVGYWRGGRVTLYALGSDLFRLRVQWRGGGTCDVGPFFWEPGCYSLRTAGGGPLMSFLNRVVESGSSGGPPGRTTGVLVECPALVEYLSAEKYPDGATRERSVISVFIEDGRVKVCLNDRDAGRTLWRSGDGVEDCLILLETGIVDGTADWRRAAGSYKGSAKRNGKCGLAASLPALYDVGTTHARSGRSAGRGRGKCSLNATATGQIRWPSVRCKQRG